MKNQKIKNKYSDTHDSCCHHPVNKRPMQKNSIPTIATIVVITILSAASPTYADNFYFGGNLGMSMTDDMANTDTLPLFAPGPAPIEAPLYGRSYDTNETSWGLVAGWNMRDWFALELSYTDLGNAGENPFGVFPFGIIVPSTPPLGNPPPDVTPVPPVSFETVFPTSLIALETEEWSLNARFQKTLFSRLSANWAIGISRAEFEAKGNTRFMTSFDPLTGQSVSFNIPIASPGSETGWNWGAGFGWDVNDWLSLDLGYRKHDTKVLDIETVSLRVMFTL